MRRRQGYGDWGRDVLVVLPGGADVEHADVEYLFRVVPRQGERPRLAALFGREVQIVED